MKISLFSVPKVFLLSSFLAVTAPSLSFSQGAEHRPDREAVEKAQETIERHERTPSHADAERERAERDYIEKLKEWQRGYREHQPTPPQ